MTKTEIKKWNKKLKKQFSHVIFHEEGHRYEIIGEDRPVKSVSSLLKYFYEEFDTETIAPKWGTERNLSVEDVKLAWEGEGTKATTWGSKVHLVGENYVRWKFLGECERPVPICKQSLGCIQFIDDLPDYLIPVAVEVPMYSRLYHYTGTFDGLLYNTRNGKFLIYDFKTNNSLSSVYEKNYLHHINQERGLLQDNFGKYSLQFSFYQLILEEYGYEVQARILVHLEEDKKNKKLYKTYKTQNLTEELKNWLETKEHLN